MTLLDEDVDGIPVKSIPQAEELGDPRWRCKVPGQGKVNVWTDGKALYACSSWGVAYAAIRLRKFDITTGAELAFARLGSEVVCVHFPEDSTIVYATTEKKLFQLDRRDLQILRKWDTGVPNSTYAMLSTPVGLLMAHGDSVSVFDLGTGKCKERRRSLGARMALLPDDQHVLVFSAEAGNLWNYDPRSGAKAVLAETFEARGGSFDHRRRNLWLFGTRPALAQSNPVLLKRIGQASFGEFPSYQEFMADIHVGAVAACEEFLVVVEIREETRPNKTWTEWVATNLHIYKLPEMAATGNWSFRFQPDAVHILPALAAAVTIESCDSESCISYFDLPGQAPHPCDPVSFRTGWD